MASVLITAFGPYGTWEANSSWLALTELARDLPSLPAVTTRLYPVDFTAMCSSLESDWQVGYDYTLHLGQAPGSAGIRLESIAVNVSRAATLSKSGVAPLFDDGPVAYQSQLPLADWNNLLLQAGIPSKVSFHAGTYLCNATMYLAHHLAQRNGFTTKSAFIHLPLDTDQVVSSGEEMPFLPRHKAAEALRIILNQLKN